MYDWTKQNSRGIPQEDTIHIPRTGKKGIQTKNQRGRDKKRIGKVV